MGGGPGKIVLARRIRVGRVWADGGSVAAAARRIEREIGGGGDASRRAKSSSVSSSPSSTSGSSSSRSDNDVSDTSSMNSDSCSDVSERGYTVIRALPGTRSSKRRKWLRFDARSACCRVDNCAARHNLRSPCRSYSKRAQPRPATPRIRCFCAMPNSTRTGAERITLPAMTTCQRTPLPGSLRSAIPSGSVRTVSSVVMTNGQK